MTFTAVSGVRRRGIMGSMVGKAQATKMEEPALRTDQAIEPVEQPAIHEVVVEHLRRAIHIGRFVPGDKFPPERELAKQLMVSRTTVREAIRVLESEGYVEIRRGSAGG